MTANYEMGSKGALVRNAERLGVDLRSVDLVVLSHHHSDHGGGLPAIFTVNDQAKVYLRRLVGIPALNTMAGREAEVKGLGRTMLNLPVDGYWTGHCTGQKAYAALKSVRGDNLAEIHTGTTMTV